MPSNLKLNNIAFVSELYGSTRHGGEQQALYEIYSRCKKKGADFYSYYQSAKNRKLHTYFPRFLRELPYYRDIFVVPFVGRRFVHQYKEKYRFINTTSTTFFAFSQPNHSTKKLISLHIIPSERAKRLLTNNVEGIKARIALNPIILYFLYILEKRSFSRADKIIVLKSEHKDTLLQKFNIPSSKIIIIANGVDADQFIPQTKKKKQVLFVGRATQAKGYDTILKAAHNVHAHFVVATQFISDEYRAESKKQNITIHISVSHDAIQKLYQESMIFILPSLEEDQPLTILEAMATGLPVITTPIGSGGLIQDEYNGFIIDYKDPKALSDKINFLLEHEKIRHRIGERNREKILQDHDWSRVATRYFDVYSSLSSL